METQKSVLLYLLAKRASLECSLQVLADLERAQYGGVLFSAPKNINNFFERKREMKSKSSTFRAVTILLLVGLLVSWSSAATIIVGPGESADYHTIQEAINNSSSGDTIEVQPDIYHEQINFYGKAITVTSTDPNNINVVYATTIDAGNVGSVVRFDSGEDDTSKLIGFTIQNGNSCGIYCYYSDPLISKCVLRFSRYGIYGSYSEPTIKDCVIRENSSTGIYDCDGEITNCNIIENSSYGIKSCDGLISNCEIKSNSGGGLYQCLCSIKDSVISENAHSGFDFGGNLYASCQIENCLISGNLEFGVKLSGNNHNYQVVNCTVTGNGRSGFYCNTLNEVTLSNNIIVSNWQYGIDNAGADLTLKYNNIWGNLDGNYDGLAPGDTDTHEDPLFALDGYWGIEDIWVEGDYHLKSIAGRWDPNSHMWVNDDVTSLCIDAGDPIGGCLDEPSPNGGRINQGAYGGTEKASRSPWGIEPYCAEYPAGDVNFDCKVDFTDFAIMSTNWLECNLVPESACWE